MRQLMKMAAPRAALAASRARGRRHLRDYDFQYRTTSHSVWNTQQGYSFPGQNTPPVFDFKREWVIGEDEKVGSRVMTVRTRDEDQDVIEYGLEPAVFLDGSSYFRINKRSGEVFLTRSLAGQAGSDYYLFITAYDGHQT
ncbi:hypothetical protein HPB47_007278, partial [Ixodes persulcatus]